MSTITSNADVKDASLFSTIASGTIAGLGGGIVFGMMMGMMGMLSMVGMLVGSQSAIVGFLVHMLISNGIGGI